jgi:hypothetical protein
LTNTDGSAELLFNGTTTFNGKEDIPTFPTGKWNSVTVGISLSAQEAIKRARSGGFSELREAILERISTIAALDDRPVLQRLSRIFNDHTNGGSITAGIMNNNNFEVPKMAADGNVRVSMGGTARSVQVSEERREGDCSNDADECEKR